MEITLDCSDEDGRVVSVAEYPVIIASDAVDLFFHAMLSAGWQRESIAKALIEKGEEYAN